MAANHDRRLSRLEEHHGSEKPGLHWLKGKTDAEIRTRIEQLIARGQAKAADLFIHWQI